MLAVVSGLTGCGSVSLPARITEANRPATTATPSPTLSRSLSAERAAVRATWKAYRAALADKNGSAALEHVSSSAHDHVEKWRDWALQADRRHLRAEKAWDQLATVLLRLAVDAETLRNGTAQDVLETAIDGGFLTDSVDGLELGDVRISNHRAFAQAMYKGDPTYLTIVFRREGDAWKLDLAEYFGQQNRALYVEAHREKRSPYEQLRKYLVETFGGRVARLAWRPVGGVETSA